MAPEPEYDFLKDPMKTFLLGSSPLSPRLGGSKAYWKLRSYESLTIRVLRQKLWDRGLFCQPNSSKVRTLKLLNRMQRKLLSYDSCSEDELQGFMKARGLQGKKPKGGQMKKTAMVRKLENADDGATLDQFMELPAEIRVSIYELSIEDMDLGRARAPAPITRVSRQVRQEALPIFNKIYDQVSPASRSKCPQVDLKPQPQRPCPSTATCTT